MNAARSDKNKEKEKVKYSKTPYRLLPSLFNDYVLLITFWTNVIALLAAFIPCVIIFNTEWAVAFIYCWTMIFEFTGLFTLRGYHAGYNWNDRWLWYSTFIIVLYYIGSMIAFIFGIIDQDDGSDEEDEYIIACMIIHVGYPVVVLYLTAGVKLQESIQQNKYYKVLALVAFFIVMITIAILLMAIWEFYASGCGILTV